MSVNGLDVPLHRYGMLLQAIQPFQDHTCPAAGTGSHTILRLGWHTPRCRAGRCGRATLPTPPRALPRPQRAMKASAPAQHVSRSATKLLCRPNVLGPPAHERNTSCASAQGLRGIPQLAHQQCDRREAQGDSMWMTCEAQSCVRTTFHALHLLAYAGRL